MRVVGRPLLVTLSLLLVLGGITAMIVGLVAIGSFTDPFSNSPETPGWFVPVFFFGGLASTVGGVVVKRSIRGSKTTDKLRRLNL